MEAEYQALSASCRDLIPLRHICKEASDALKINGTFIVRSHSKIYEDNSACLSQATMPKMTPRTKHIAVANHWFREYVSSGDIEVLKIDTTKQGLGSRKIYSNTQAAVWLVSSSFLLLRGRVETQKNS